MVVACLKSSSMKMIVDAVSEIVDTVVMDFSEKGVMMQAMDASHVSLCVLELKPEGFSEYSCDVPRNIGVSLSNMSKIFKCSSGEDTMEITLKDTDKMGLSFKGESSALDFEMKLMEIDSEYLQIPEVEYDSTVTMSSSEFQKIVKGIGSIGETCSITVRDGSMKFMTDGDIGEGTFKPLDKEGLEINGETKCKFANRYLQMFTKASPLCKTVSIKLSSDNPMCLEYNMGDLGVLKYYLAPKIEDDDDME